MERIFLKPISKEILFKANEPDVFFDSFEYGPRGDKDKHLGYLYVIGHLKFGEENMAYVLNLISSLAKREYYSENGNILEDPKKAFELALKKLNDVLEDFFKNKDLKINLGLLAIAGEKIYISKLGKFKVFLARANEMIDILNNVDLFQREQTEEKQFSNIVSGKIQEKDKLFAVFPTRQITAREKNIKALLAEKKQDDFITELTSVHASSKNFPCCGFHIEINKVKENEIPIRSVYETSKIAPESALTTQTLETKAEERGTNIKLASEQTAEPAPDIQQTKVNLSEMSIIKRGNIFRKISQKIPYTRGARNLRPKRNWVIGLILVLILGGGSFVLKNFIFGQSNQKSVINTASENIKMAETKITQNDNTAARELLALSLSSITGMQETSKKITEIRERINTLLDKIDLVSSKQPEPFFVSPSYVISQITSAEENGILTAINQGRVVLKIDSTGASEILSIPGPDSVYSFQTGKNFSVFNGFDKLGVLNTESKKYSAYTLKESEPVKDAAMYENNLYILGESAIYKYPDAATGNTQKQLWLGGLTDPSKLSITVDGNVYVLHADGTVITYFKGKEIAKINLNLKFDYQVRLLANKSSPYFYAADYTEKRIRVFDKITGSLVLTYKATQLPLLKKAVLAEDALYFLTIDSQIWKIGF